MGQICAAFRETLAGSTRRCRRFVIAFSVLAVTVGSNPQPQRARADQRGQSIEIVNETFDDGTIDPAVWESDGKWNESKGYLFNTGKTAYIKTKESRFSKKFVVQTQLVVSKPTRCIVTAGDGNAAARGLITGAECVVDTRSHTVALSWFENGVRRGTASKSISAGKRASLTLTSSGSQVTATLGSAVLSTEISSESLLSKGRIAFSVSRGRIKIDRLRASYEADTPGAPIASPDSVTTQMNTAATFDPLQNDTGDGIVLDGISSSPSHGRATHNSDGTLTYTPDSGFTGSDRLRYRIRDSIGQEAEGDVSVRIDGTPPSSFFTLGLANDPGSLDWMTSSGVPWDQRYQYLAGGVNTGSGWATWNSPAGQFATLYLNASDGAGYEPVFTYYQIVQSSPNPGDENPDPKLTNPATMNAYFADWKLLMQKCGAFGKRVIVHHEPDLWAYMQLRHGDNPANTSVSVASCGFAEAAGFANNAIGFAQAIAAIRTTYAPNVRLAWHASGWATGVDVILNNGDPVALGGRVAAFFNALNASFDLVFFDPSDRDAGFYQYIYGDGGAHWWNDADFVTFRRYVETITSATGRKGMLWQVPIGNTLYRSCNNTWDHYQDNRPQYFLQSGNRQHIVDYVNAGVIGILFGRGADGPTTYSDDASDGITNPSPINGNTAVAAYSDDDGGFLRLAAAAYYAAGPVPIP